MSAWPSQQAWECPPGLSPGCGPGRGAPENKTKSLKEFSICHFIFFGNSFTEVQWTYAAFMVHFLVCRLMRLTCLYTHEAITPV